MENKIEQQKDAFFARGHIENPKKNRKYYYIKKDDPNFPNIPERAWKKLVTQKYFDNHLLNDEYNTEEEYEDDEWINYKKEVQLKYNK
jgi:hypothetical protein